MIAYYIFFKLHVLHVEIGAHSNHKVPQSKLVDLSADEGSYHYTGNVSLISEYESVITKCDHKV